MKRIRENKEISILVLFAIAMLFIVTFIVKDIRNTAMYKQSVMDGLKHKIERSANYSISSVNGNDYIE